MGQYLMAFCYLDPKGGIRQGLNDNSIDWDHLVLGYSYNTSLLFFFQPRAGATLLK
jgi:hypothetical protein